MNRAATPTRPSRPSRTAPTRDIWADAVRAVALLVVVLGHWMLAVVGTTAAGETEVRTLFVAAPGTHWITLALQVMGAFFLVGGMVSVRSWRRARAAAEETDLGGAYASWLGSRAAGLVGPVLPLLALWVVLTPALVAAGLDERLAAMAGGNALAPLWFLVVYLLVQAAVPAVDAAVARWGWVRPTAALMAGSAAVDLAARGHDIAIAGFGGFLTVWLVPVVLGVALADGRLTPWHGRRLALLGAAGVAALVTLLDYPVLMVGTMPDGGSNQNPPSLALAFLILCHVGLLVVTRRRLTAALASPRAVRLTGLAATWSMPVFLWHMSAMALAIGASLVLPAATGHLLAIEPLSVAWWASRPLWWLALLLWTLPLLGISVLQGRLGVRPAAASSPRAVLVGVVAGVVGIAVGSAQVHQLGTAVASLVAVGLSAWLVGALPRFVRRDGRLYV